MHRLKGVIMDKEEMKKEDILEEEAANEEKIEEAAPETTAAAETTAAEPEPGEPQLTDEDEKALKKKKTEETIRIATNVVITIFSVAALLGSIVHGAKDKFRS
jgi:hypothetical protein